MFRVPRQSERDGCLYCQDKGKKSNLIFPRDIHFSINFFFCFQENGGLKTPRTPPGYRYAIKNTIAQIACVCTFNIKMLLQETEKIEQCIYMHISNSSTSHHFHSCLLTWQPLQWNHLNCWVPGSCPLHDCKCFFYCSPFTP